MTPGSDDFRPLVRVCAWCVGAGVASEVERQREAIASGALVSHGMCPACAEVFSGGPPPALVPARTR